MRKLLLTLAFVLAPALAQAQCNGIFPANTLCGNLTGSPAPPAAFSAAGTVVGPGTSVVNNFALWNNTSGTLLKDAGFTTGTSGHAVPFLDGTNVWSGGNTFTTITATTGNITTVNASAVNINSAPVRTPLLGDTTYYIRTDGNNNCNGLTNAAGSSGNCAWADAQFALDYASHNIDLKGHALILQFGEAISSWTLTTAITCNAPFIGYGTVTLQGSAGWATPGAGTFLSGKANSVSAISIASGCTIFLSQLQVESNVATVTCLGPQTMFFKNFLWVGSALTDIFASQHCEIEQVGPDIINYTTTSSEHIQASHHGEFRNAAQTTTFNSDAAYLSGSGGTFAYAGFLGSVVYTSAPTINLNSHTVTGQRCFVDYNGIVEAAGLGVNFFPGNSPCPTPGASTATGGVYLD